MLEMLKNGSPHQAMLACNQGDKCAGSIEEFPWSHPSNESLLLFLRQAYGRIILFYIQMIGMKVLKKAKIVNLSLNSPNPPPNIHLSQESLPEASQTSSLKQQQILNDCYEAIKIIATEKAKALAHEKKNIMKTTTDAFLQLKKTDKQNDLRIPITIADSIELILKRFIKLKAQQEHQAFANHSPKLRLISGKNNSSKGFILKKFKENTEGSVGDKTEDYSCDIFKSLSPNAISNDKLQNKICELQRQIANLKQKLDEQNAAIAKLEGRQLLLRKKHQDELNRIIRAKNIVDIQTSYQKQTEARASGRALLNVNGKSIVSVNKSRIKDEDVSKRSSHSVADETELRQSLALKKKQPAKHDEKFKPYASTGNMFGNYLFNNLKNLKEVATDLKDQFSAKDNLTHAQHTIQPEYAVENEQKSQKEEQFIGQTGVQLLGDEEFEAMEMNGFYDEPEPKVIVQE